jgi:hypothetical protein
MKKLLLGLAILAAMVFGFIACEPTDPPVPAYVGVWEGSDLPTSSFHYDAVFTLWLDGTYESLLYDVGGTTLQDMSTRGTYTMVSGVMYSTVTEMYSSGSWAPATMSNASPCTVVGDTLTLSVDFTGDGIPDEDWVLTRQ